MASPMSVYIGILDEDGLNGAESGPCIQYTTASQGSEWMTTKILPKDVGVTWGALLENPGEETFQQYHLWKPPTPEVAAPEPTEGEDPPSDTPPPNVYYPVNIDCVTDVEKI